MKKEQKRNLLLASVTALLLLIIYIMMPSGAGGKAGEEESLVVYSMDADTVTGIAFQSGDERIVLVRQEDGWVYAEDGTFPLNQGFVDTMLDKTARLTARRFVAEGSGYFGGYGLDHPTNVIQVTGVRPDRNHLSGQYQQRHGGLLHGGRGFGENIHGGFHISQPVLKQPECHGNP